MWRLLALTVVGSALFAAGLGLGLALDGSAGESSRPQPEPNETRAVVVSVIDGDTVVLDNGERVRYLGIDTAEVGPQECFAVDATERNRQMVEGKRVTLVRENEDRDRFDRLLRWIWLEDGTFVNAELVWEGYARPFFFGDSRYRQVFVQMALAASQTESGGWSECGWK